MSPGCSCRSPLPSNWGAAFLIVGGYHTRTAALLLAGFCLATAVLFHGRLGDRNQLLHFEKDMAIAGGLLVLFAHGAGAWALDALPAFARGRWRGPKAESAPPHESPELLTPHARSRRQPLEFMQISRIPALEPFARWRD